MKSIRQKMNVLSLQRIVLAATFSLIVTLVCVIVAYGHDYVPGKTQSHPILLRGGDLYTVSNGVMNGVDLLFDKGRIVTISKNMAAPADATVIDCAGKRVYPGLMAPVTCLGLVEIEQARATVDKDEVGNVTPEVQAKIAYNPDSEVLPTVRLNGVTTVQVMPTGGLLAGSSDLINLDGWNREDAVEKPNVGMHLDWPSVSVVESPFVEQSAEEQKKQNEEDRRNLYRTFDEAHAYLLARKANPSMNLDLRWEAMAAVFSREMPLFISADDYRQIEQAVEFAKKYDVRIVLVGASDAWRCLELLKKYDIPVITPKVQSLPIRQDDNYDRGYCLPKILADAGVRFCISDGAGTTWQARNLPFQAGQAAAFGLTKEQALRAVTLSTAEIFGVATDLGSLEVGKKATLVVSNGDVLDQLTNDVVYEFIEGRQVDLSSRHTELYQKYSQKHTR